MTIQAEYSSCLRKNSDYDSSLSNLGLQASIQPTLDSIHFSHVSKPTPSSQKI